MTTLVAQAGLPGTIGGWAILIIVVAAVVGILLVILRQMEVQIPPFVIKIGWILVAAVVGILAVGFLLRLGGLM
jgi:hypothetical protein